jgi:hypothetical protein
MYGLRDVYYWLHVFQLSVFIGFYGYRNIETMVVKWWLRCCWLMLVAETWIDLERPGLKMEFILSQPTAPPKGAPLGAAFSSSSRLAAAN